MHRNPFAQWSNRWWPKALAPVVLGMACALMAQTPTPPDAPPAATQAIQPPQPMPAEIVDDCARASTTARCSGGASRPGNGAAPPGRLNAPATRASAGAGRPNCQSQCRLGATMAAECRPLCKEMAASPAASGVAR